MSSGRSQALLCAAATTVATKSNGAPCADCDNGERREKIRELQVIVVVSILYAGVQGRRRRRCALASACIVAAAAAAAPAAVSTCGEAPCWNSCAAVQGRFFAILVSGGQRCFCVGHCLVPCFFADALVAVAATLDGAPTLTLTLVKSALFALRFCGVCTCSSRIHRLECGLRNSRGEILRTLRSPFRDIHPSTTRC